MSINSFFRFNNYCARASQMHKWIGVRLADCKMEKKRIWIDSNDDDDSGDGRHAFNCHISCFKWHLHCEFSRMVWKLLDGESECASPFLDKHSPTILYIYSDSIFFSPTPKWNAIVCADALWQPKCLYIVI